MSSGALPSSKGIERTIKSVTPFGRAKGVTLSLAAHPGCYAPSGTMHLGGTR